LKAAAAEIRKARLVGRPVSQRLKWYMGQINVRFAKSEDARGILEAHYSAVHETAAKDYPLEIRRRWSTPVTLKRIDEYLRNALPNETTVVADVDGKIAGFGVIIESNNELRAVYVAAEFGNQGVGSALLRELERLAKERGCRELHMDSSLTAAPFYLHHGYEELGRADHTLSSGHTMAGVRMRKVLE
jgi:putative acetyltransferase